MDRPVFYGMLLALLFASGALPTSADGAGPVIYSSQQAKKIIVSRARAVVTALHDRKMNGLASYVHPTRGLRFSPYVAATKSDRVFSRAQVRRLGRNAARYEWGHYDGSGDPIRLTWREYYKQFVYNRNFAAAREINYNTFRQRGNDVNNLKSFYPHTIAVEYFVPDPKKDGNDWHGLWLIFQPRGHVWYLTGIVHDQWTI